MLIAAFGADARGLVRPSLIVCSSDNNSTTAMACRKLQVGGSADQQSRLS